MPCTYPKTLPTIDISSAPYSIKHKHHVLESIRAACKDKGFFIISGHGISLDLQEQMFAQAKAFFALPLDQKLTIDEGLARQSHRGYQRIGGEGNQPGKLPDLKEV